MRLEIVWRKGWAHIHGTGPDGKRVRKSAKTRDPKQAEEQRAALEARLWKIHHHGAEAVMTFDAGAVAYAEHGGETRFLMPIAKYLEGVRLKDLSGAMARDCAKKLYPQASNATLNRQVITPIRAVVNFCCEQKWCPPVRISSFPTETKKRQAVGRDYIEALRPHLPERLYVMMRFLHETGRRVGDAIAMEPEWIIGRTVNLPKTKNGDPARVVMTEDTAKLVHGLEARHGRVFGYMDRSSVYKTLRRAAKKATVPYLGTHQPGRHSFATTLHEAGWQSSAIAEAGGWKSVRLVAERYEHPTEAQSRAADVFSGKRLPRAKKRSKLSAESKGE